MNSTKELNADLCEVYRRLAGNPPDVYAIERGEIIATGPFFPGSVIPCIEPQEVRVVPWYRVNGCVRYFNKEDIRRAVALLEARTRVNPRKTWIRRCFNR